MLSLRLSLNKKSFNDSTSSSGVRKRKDGIAAVLTHDSCAFKLRRSTLRAFYIQFIYNLLNVRHAGGKFFNLLALSRCINIAFQREHAILGVKTDVLLFQPIRDD